MISKQRSILNPVANTFQDYQRALLQAHHTREALEYAKQQRNTALETIYQKQLDFFIGVYNSYVLPE